MNNFMTQIDRQNLRFLLETDMKHLKEWYTGITVEEREYAQSLLAQYAEECLVEGQLQNSIDCPITEFTESNEYLKKYRL